MWYNDYRRRYSDILGDSKIDRAQLFGEVKFHIICYKKGIFSERANPIDIDVLADGTEKDDDWYINFWSAMHRGGYYEDEE